MSSLLSWGWLSDLTVATLMLACEVGGSDDQYKRFNEMRLVAWVVHNRVDSERFNESTVPEVILAPKQFSCVGDRRWRGLLDGSRTVLYPRGWPPILDTAKLAWRAVEWERSQGLSDPTRGATMYFSPVSMDCPRCRWNADRTMPYGWPVELVETTPEYVDSNRFRFFAFPEELKPAEDSNKEENHAQVLEGIPVDISGLDAPCERPADSQLPSPGAPSDAGGTQPPRRTGYNAAGAPERD